MNPSRDIVYAAIEEIVDKHIAEHGEMPDSDVVTELLFEHHHDVLMRYVEGALPSMVRNYLVIKYLGTKRASLARRAARGEISIEDSDIMAAPFHVPGVGWKTVGDMTGTDHLAVAHAYQRIAEISDKRATLHRALANRVGKKTTRAAMSPSQLVNELREAYGPEGLTPITQIATT